MLLCLFFINPCNFNQKISFSHGNRKPYKIKWKHLEFYHSQNKVLVWHFLKYLEQNQSNFGILNENCHDGILRQIFTKNHLQRVNLTWKLLEVTKQLVKGIKPADVKVSLALSLSLSSNHYMCNELLIHANISANS